MLEMCSDLKKRMEGNLATYDEVITDFENLYLFPAEVLVLERFREQWREFEVLDIGVGVGRTAWVFSPRKISQLSKGEGCRPSAFCANTIFSLHASSLQITAPPSASLWPLVYLVVLNRDRSAPSSSGRCR